MKRTLLRGFAAAFALWFALASGEHGLVRACVGSTAGAAGLPGGVHHGGMHHGPAPTGSPSAPAHAPDHTNCLDHCCGVTGAPFTVAPTLAARSFQWLAPALESSAAAPAVASAYDHPFAIGPPAA